MGTGSSRCSPARRWRRSRWGSAPVQPSCAEEQQRAEDAAARCSPALAQSPLPPLGEPDSDSELLDQALAECDAVCPVQPRPGQFSCSPAGGGGRGDQARGDCRQNDNCGGSLLTSGRGHNREHTRMGNCWSYPIAGWASFSEGFAQMSKAVMVENSRRCSPAEILLTRVTPASENSNFANNFPLKKAETKSKISYDYSEEEMMAAIEQEYGC